MRSAAAGRLRTAFELHELGVRMYRQRLTRELPDASDDRTGTPSRRFG